MVALSLAAASASCDAPPPPSAPKKDVFRSRAVQEAKDNPGRIRDLRARCDETPEEGKAIVEKARNWVPVVNGNPGDKPLKDVTGEYVKKGIYEVCWGASKKSTGSWKIWLDYIDIQGGYHTAEWEYDPVSGEMRTFNADSMTFWTGKL